MSFEVQTDGYEGPISLLLSLISAQKVDIWHLHIAELVDAYLAELDRMAELDLDIATEFLVVASTLLELKCRKLFPDMASLEIDEEFLFFEERDLLIARLLEVKAYRDASEAFVRSMSEVALTVPRAGTLDEPWRSLMPDILAGITPERLANSLRRLIIEDDAQAVDVSHLPSQPFSIAHVARNIVSRLRDLGSCSFAVLIGEANSRFEVVVGFLAILELYKHSRIDISQEGFADDLSLSWASDALSDEELDLFLTSAGFER